MNMRTMYWPDIQALLEGIGYILERDPHGPGLQWSINGVALVCQKWEEPPREFHWRAIYRLRDAGKITGTGPQGEGEKP